MSVGRVMRVHHASLSKIASFAGKWSPCAVFVGWDGVLRVQEYGGGGVGWRQR